MAKNYRLSSLIYADQQPSAGKKPAAKVKPKGKAKRPVDRFGGLGLPHGYMPPAADTEAGAAEHAAIRELIKARTGRDVGESFDPVTELRNAGVLPVVSSRGAAVAGRARLGGREYASAADALDAALSKENILSLGQRAFERQSGVEALKGAANLIDFIRSSPVEDKFAKQRLEVVGQKPVEFTGEKTSAGENASRIFGGVGRAVWNLPTIPDRFDTRKIEVVGQKPVEFAGEQKTVGESTINALGAGAIGAAGLASGAAKVVSNIPVSIPTLSPAGLRIQSTAGGELYTPSVAEPRTLGDVNTQFESMARNPAQFVPMATSDNTTPIKTTNAGLLAGTESALAGQPPFVIDSVVKQQNASPFSKEEILTLQSRARDNGWDISDWNKLTPGEWLFRAYSKSDGLSLLIRSTARNIGELGSVPAGVVAVLNAAGASAKTRDPEQLKLLFESAIAPYAKWKDTYQKKGLDATMLEIARDDPMTFVAIVSAMAKGAGVVAGAAVRAGLIDAAASGAARVLPKAAAERVRAFGKSSVEFAQRGRTYVATGPSVREYVRIPIEEPAPAGVGQAQRRVFLEEQRTYPERVAAARADDRIDKTTGLPYEVLPIDRPGEYLVGTTGASIFSPISLELKKALASAVPRVGPADGSWSLSDRLFNAIVAPVGNRYRLSLGKRQGSLFARLASNVAQGESIEIRQTLENALSKALGKRVPTWLEKERAAFELIWPKFVEAIEGQRVYVTPRWVAEQFDALAAEVEAKFARERPGSRVGMGEVAKLRAQARIYRMIDDTLLGKNRIEHDAAVASLREVAKPFGLENDRLVAQALGKTVEEVKRENYIRLRAIDPSFEQAARLLYEERNKGKVDLIKAQNEVARLAGDIRKYASEGGWGKKSKPKSRARFARVRRDLIARLRDAERLALKYGDEELAASYRADRALLVLGRRGTSDRVAEFDAMVARLSEGQLSDAELAALPEAARPAYEAAATAREAASSQGVDIANLEAERQRLLSEVGSGRKVVNQAHIAKAERDLALAKAELKRLEDQAAKDGIGVERTPKNADFLEAGRYAKKDDPEIVGKLKEANRGTGFVDVGKYLYETNPENFWRLLDEKRGVNTWSSQSLRIKTIENARRRVVAFQDVRDRLRAVEDVNNRLAEARAGLAETQKTIASNVREAKRIIEQNRPVIDTDQFAASIDASRGIAGVRIRKKSDFEWYTIEQARNESLDAYIARVEAADQGAVLHLMQRANIKTEGPLGYYDGPRRIDTSVTSGGFNSKRLLESQGALFKSGQEATTDMWKNLMFDTSELIVAEGWRNKTRQFIEATSLRVTFDASDVDEISRVSAALREANPLMGESQSMQEAAKQVLDKKGIEFQLQDFKVLNPDNPSAKVPSDRASVGVLEEMDPDSAQYAMWSELNSRTIDMNSPGTYYLMPRGIYDGLQKTIADEAFRFRPGSLSGKLDRAMRVWRSFTLNILPRTAFNNIAGSAILALEGGAGVRSLWYAFNAITGRLDKFGRKMPVPPELRQRWEAQLTTEVNLGGGRRSMENFGNPTHFEIAAGYLGWWMNLMRKLNAGSEDFARLAVWYSRAVPAAIRADAVASGEARVLFTNMRQLTDGAHEMIYAMATGDPQWQSLHSQWLRQSFDFLGDLHRGGKVASMMRIAIPFQQWYTHILKLTFITMPLKYPGREVFLQTLGRLGQEYQNAHGVMVPWGTGYIPVSEELVSVSGAPQWVTNVVSSDSWWPQAFAAGFADRTGKFTPALSQFQSTLNPQIMSAAYTLSAVTAFLGVGPALAPDSKTFVGAAKDEFGNDVSAADREQIFWFVVSRLQEQMPLAPTIMSMAARPDTASVFNRVEKAKQGPHLKTQRVDLLSVLNDPWSFNPLLFALKAATGMQLGDWQQTPGVGPIYSKQLRDEFAYQEREALAHERNIAKTIQSIWSESFATPLETPIQPTLKNPAG